jgi:hypothetical protein
MMLAEYEKFLQSARSLLDRFMFDGDAMRDNVATLCMTIDDVLPSNADPASTVQLPNVEAMNAATHSSNGRCGWSALCRAKFPFSAFLFTRGCGNTRRKAFTPLAANRGSPYRIGYPCGLENPIDIELGSVFPQPARAAILSTLCAHAFCWQDRSALPPEKIGGN